MRTGPTTRATSSGPRHPERHQRGGDVTPSYPPQESLLTTDRTTVPAGHTVTMSVTKCPTGKPTATLDGQNLNVAVHRSTNGKGLTATATIPASATPGKHTLSAGCEAGSAGTTVLHVSEAAEPAADKLVFGTQPPSDLARCCTCPSPAWPTNVPSSCSTRRSWRSHSPRRLHHRVGPGRPVAVAELQPVDLVVCGSVAVNRGGARVGKGGGATTVHPLQLLEEALPETGHDFRLDLIVTGEEAIACQRTRRPQEILWEHLDAAKVAAIPALAARAPGHVHS